MAKIEISLWNYKLKEHNEAIKQLLKDEWKIEKIDTSLTIPTIILKK